MNRVSHAAYLPLPRRPPHDPRRLPLGPIPGWRGQRLHRVEQVPDGALGLARLPGAERRLNEPGGTLGGLTLPPNLVPTDDGALLLLDRAQALIKRFDPCDCVFRTLPHTGGIGTGARQLADPGGMAVCGDTLLVADSGNARVSVYGLHGYPLRAFWTPPAGVPAQTWRPLDLALCGHRVLVADPSNGCVHCFDFAGRWLGCSGGLGAVSRIAVGCSGTLYVITDANQPALLLDPTTGEHIGEAIRSIDVAADFPPLPFDVGADGSMNLGPRCTGDGAAAWFDTAGNPMAPPPANPGPVYFDAGSYVSEPLDSDLYRCQWDRLTLEAEVPHGTRIQVLTYSAEALLSRGQLEDLPEGAWSTRQTLLPTAPGMQEWDCLLRAEPGRFLWLRLELRGDGLITPAVRGMQIDFPRIGLRRYLPAIFGEEPIAADFTDRFLAVFDRGLREVEGEIDDLAQYFDPLSAQAGSGKGDFLTWLAGWIGVTLDRQLPLERRRALVKQAGRLFACRGTVTGLRRMLDLYLGLGDRSCARAADCGPCTTREAPTWQPPEIILEHFKLRRWLFLGQGRLGERARIWGQSIVNRSQLGGSHTGGNARLGVTQLKTSQDPHRDPFHVYAHRFTLFLPGWIARNPGFNASLERLVSAQKPAHTAHSIRYVEPRFRIGVQAVIGFDSVVGCWPSGVSLADADGAGDRLGRATVLGGAGGSERVMRVGRRTRIGATTRLR